MKQTIEEIVEKLKAACHINDEMQKETAPGSPGWHKHESIDDSIFEALALLGE